ncbi:hypothetical protein F5141DRAFT_1064054 [Pisolithus sp. B1]|nr:hypothetical protein F5141DRAFT_1064054 [Pisolithus sp. B1]
MSNQRSKSSRKSAARLLSVLFQGHTGQFASSRIQVVMVWPFRTLVGECPHISRSADFADRVIQYEIEEDHARQPGRQALSARNRVQLCVSALGLVSTIINKLHISGTVPGSHFKRTCTLVWPFTSRSTVLASTTARKMEASKVQDLCTACGEYEVLQVVARPCWINIPI